MPAEDLDAEPRDIAIPTQRRRGRTRQEVKAPSRVRPRLREFSISVVPLIVYGFGGSNANSFGAISTLICGR